MSDKVAECYGVVAIPLSVSDCKVTFIVLCSAHNTYLNSISRDFVAVLKSLKKYERISSKKFTIHFQRVYFLYTLSLSGSSCPWINQSYQRLFANQYTHNIMRTRVVVFCTRFHN